MTMRPCALLLAALLLSATRVQCARLISIATDDGIHPGRQLLDSIPHFEGYNDVTVAKEWNALGYWETLCYVNWGRLEKYAIQWLCDSIANGTSQYILRLQDSSCRSGTEVTVTTDPEGVPTISPNICPVDAIHVKVVYNECYLFTNTSAACIPPLDNGNTDIVKTHPMFYAIERFRQREDATNGKEVEDHSFAGAKFKVEFKSNCTSTASPVFRSWFSSGTLKNGTQCPAAPTPAPAPAPWKSDDDDGRKNKDKKKEGGYRSL